MTDPSFQLGSFSEDGWSFVAYQPMNDQEDRVLRIVAKKGEHTFERKVPMMHENRFGIDVEDMDALNVATEELRKSLGLSDD